MHHVGLTSGFAQLEFSSVNGDKERGRTIFEGLFDTFPRRLDLWNVLIDLEIKARCYDQARKLFDRITSERLRAKKAKFFFNKWLRYEEEQGDQRGVERVKSKVARFTGSQTNPD